MAMDLEDLLDIKEALELEPEESYSAGKEESLTENDLKQLIR